MKKLFGKIFNRITIVAILVILQFLWIFNAFWMLSRYAVWINALLTVISLLMVLYLVRKDLDPAYKIAWILLCCLAPLFGGMMYLMFGDKRPGRDMRRRMEQVSGEHEKELSQQAGVQEEMEPRSAALSHYITQYGPYPAWRDTAAQYYPLGDDVYAPLLRDLESAKKFIFLEFFIISKGEMWDTILDILQRKAAEGVDVRVIYDDVGSAPALPPHLADTLAKSGIQGMAFNPMVPILAIVMNHRDHRKIAVIDGNVAYTGGFNLADEYINRVQRFGKWKDSAVRLEGAAVWNFTVMFLNMWNAFHSTDETYDAFRPQKLPQNLQDAGVVQPYCDSPLDEESVGENVYLDILGQAQKYVYIFTPYLIIDSEMMRAMQLAAKRGVDVRIVVPAIPDKRIVYRLTRSYFPPLLKAGVKIYTYTPGFIHAKSFVSDDRFATVGTINLDYRSLYLHFECGTLFSDGPVISQLKEDCLATFECSHAVQANECRDSFFGILFDDLLRLLSPLL